MLEHQNAPQTYGVSLWFGSALIVVGVLINAGSAWHHARLVNKLRQGEPPPPRPSTQAIAIAIFLSLIGLAMVIYLISVRGSELSGLVIHTSEMHRRTLGPYSSTVPR